MGRQVGSVLAYARTRRRSSTATSSLNIMIEAVTGRFVLMDFDREGARVEGADPTGRRSAR
jgi:hypothetical protein